jgi:thymidylate kinase
MIFFDRYYHDHLADPRRYRSGAPKWLVRLVGRLIPMPDLFLVMDVLPEAARQRKAEVSAEESARQFGAYRALCAELPNAHLIDANRSPGEVASQCEGVVVRAMAARLQGRARHARV